jgi:glycine/D-amino acid oxidase-like deaminating enzyme
MHSKQICIIGQGLAGTILAHQLNERDCDYLIYDLHDPKRTSSWVAGGLFNPVTGKRNLKTWMADELFESLFEFYPAMEAKLQTRFFHPMPLLRIFDSVRSQNEGLEKASSGLLDPFTALSDFHESGYAHPTKDLFGSLEIHQSGYLDTRSFLEDSRRYFGTKKRLVETRYTLDQVKDTENIFIWCTGFSDSSITSQYNLCFKPVKGEVLTIALPDLKIEHILLGQGIFVIPLYNGHYRLGATYDWDITNTEPTKEAAKDLLRKFNELLGFETEVKVISHESGIRPATPDRRPLIGPILGMDGHYIFNGFGSKGVSLIPYFAQRLIQHLFDHVPLPEEISLSRF